MATLNMAMVRSYGRLIIAGRRTIDDVPEMYRQAVQDWIDGQTAQ